MNHTNNFTEEYSRAEFLLQKWYVRIGLMVAVWSLVALFFATQVYMLYYREEKPVPFSRALFVEGVGCLLWLLSTPLVLWLARRFRIGRINWQRRVPLHFLFGLGLVSTMLTIDYVIYMFGTARPSNLTPLRILQFIIYNVDRWLLTYWVTVLSSHAFNYYKSFRKGELNAEQLRTQLAQSQLEALKMQLHPHFLFNTLHSISALLNKDVDAARTMISRLGDFLRMTLENSGTQEVPLHQELEFLNGYLEIERIRFQDRLTTSVKVDPNVLDVRVPNLILQPIVENAMRHAIATHSKIGRIEIVAGARNGMLRIEVKDNGPGLTSVVSPGNLKQGVGLANTRARLERLYGANHRFELANEAAGGFVVTLEIPRVAEQTLPESKLAAA
ncbi:MAG: two-component system, LytTR family, sensor kinase [Blastocatellia bacterium]|jgi:sensor histidine kinase YesM|nr:two-component system, LytTR family, sensor kinase [Blastocatellia bacterium]